MLVGGLQLVISLTEQKLLCPPSVSVCCSGRLGRGTGGDGFLSLSYMLLIKRLVSFWRLIPISRSWVCLLQAKKLSLKPASVAWAGDGAVPRTRWHPMAYFEVITLLGSWRLL